MNVQLVFHIIAGFSASYFPFIHCIPELCYTGFCSPKGCITALGISRPKDHDLWYPQQGLGSAPFSMSLSGSQWTPHLQVQCKKLLQPILLFWKLLAARTWRKTGSSGPHVLITLAKSIMHRKGTCWQWKWLESALPVQWVNWEFISTGDNSFQIPFRVSPAWGRT